MKSRISLLIATPLITGSQKTFLKADKPSNKIALLNTKINSEKDIIDYNPPGEERKERRGNVLTLFLNCS